MIREFKEFNVYEHCTLNGNYPIFEKMPNGWRVINGTLTQPLGTCWICNGEQLFKNGHINKERKTALLFTDKNLYIEVKDEK